MNVISDKNTYPTNAFLEYEMPHWVGFRIVCPSGMGFVCDLFLQLIL